jgi:hypothetical protein
MGLGKTVQTLAAVELLVRERGIERVLVVAPASVKYQWETEIRKYTAPRACRSSTAACRSAARSIASRRFIDSSTTRSPCATSTS